jgi:hypothetical protein
MQQEEQSSKDCSSSTPLDENSNDTGKSVHLPIALRKGTRAATSKSIQRYGFNDRDWQLCSV